MGDAARAAAHGLRMDSVAVWGAHGWIGGMLRAALGDRAVAVPRARRLEDPADRAAVLADLRARGIERLLVAAAITGSPNVDACEDEPLRSATRAVNHAASVALAEACAAAGVFVLFVSSGCVFTYDDDHPNVPDAELGFTEADRPNFAGSVYSASKAALEWDLVRRGLLAYDPKDAADDDGGVPPPPHVGLVRIRMPLGPRDAPSPRDLLVKLRRHRFVVDDAWNSVTTLPAWIPVMVQLVNRKAAGIWNLVDDDPVTPWELLQTQGGGVDDGQKPISYTALQPRGLTRAGRSNCVLSNRKVCHWLREQGLEVPATARERLPAMATTWVYAAAGDDDGDTMATAAGGGGGGAAGGGGGV